MKQLLLYYDCQSTNLDPKTDFVTWRNLHRFAFWPFFACCFPSLSKLKRNESNRNETNDELNLNPRHAGIRPSTSDEKAGPVSPKNFSSVRHLKSDDGTV